MKTTRILGAMLGVFLATTTNAAEPTAPSGPNPVLFESATLGTLGDFGGYGLMFGCYVGSRFVVNEPAVVTAVGSHLNRYHGHSVFAALVALDPATGFPSGTPFSPYEVVAASKFEVNEPISSDYVFPLSAQLAPGHYGIIFGKGLFGDDPEDGTVIMILNNTDRPESRPYFQWSSTANRWEDGRETNVRLVVYGSSQPMLQIARLSPAQVELSWPAIFTNCVLETSQGGLATSDWSVVTSACSLQGSRLLLTNSVDVGSRFYRLRKN